MWRILSVGVFVSLQWSVVLICVLMRLHLTGAASCLFYFEGKATRLPVDFGNCRQISDLKFPVSLKPLNTKNIKTSTMLLQHLNVNVVFFNFECEQKSNVAVVTFIIIFTLCRFCRNFLKAGTPERSSGSTSSRNTDAVQNKTQSVLSFFIYLSSKFQNKLSVKRRSLTAGSSGTFQLPKNKYLVFPLFFFLIFKYWSV